MPLLCLWVYPYSVFMVWEMSRFIRYNARCAGVDRLLVCCAVACRLWTAVKLPTYLHQESATETRREQNRNILKDNKSILCDSAYLNLKFNPTKL